MKVMAQLAFNGNCRQAFEYYEKVLYGKITVMNALGDTPDVPLPPGSKPSAPEHIRFAELQVGDWALLGNDVPPDEFEPMRGFNMALHAQSVAEATRIFQRLGRGRQSHGAAHAGGLGPALWPAGGPLRNPLAHSCLG
jgi:PhnB protein